MMKSGAIDESQISDFQSEMNLMKSIKPHPNIIQVLRSCSTPEGALCIVTGTQFY